MLVALTWTGIFQIISNKITNVVSQRLMQLRNGYLRFSLSFLVDCMEVLLLPVILLTTHLTPVSTILWVPEALFLSSSMFWSRFVTKLMKLTSNIHFMMGEACFYLTAYINSQNTCHWYAERPVCRAFTMMGSSTHMDWTHREYNSRYNSWYKQLINHVTTYYKVIVIKQTCYKLSAT